MSMKMNSGLGCEFCLLVVNEQNFDFVTLNVVIAIIHLEKVEPL